MLSYLKTAEQQRARELRSKGWSIKEIERALGVSRSSASTWVRDVKLGPEQLDRLAARTPLGPIVAGARKAARAREVRRSQQAEGRRLAQELDANYAAGCSPLYGSIQEYGGFDRPEWLD